MIFIFTFISSILLFKKFGYSLLQNDMKEILESKRTFDKQKIKEQITYTNILKIKNNFNNSSNANFPPKRNINKEPNIIINDINFVENNTLNENNQKSKFSENEKNMGDSLTINNKRKKRKRNNMDYISDFGPISITRKDEDQVKVTFNDYELNSFQYSDAILKDNRNCFEYYISLIKRNQPIAFAFFPIKDNNLIIIKICIFCLSFSIYYTANYFYFSEKVIHKIYIDGGKYDFLYFFWKIVIAFVISYFLTVIIKLIFLSERDILQVRLQDTYYQANAIIPKVKRNITIKYLIFFILGMMILTQIIVFENTLISFGLALIYPFFYNIIPCLFRIYALNSRSECLYNVSKVLQIL